MRTNVFNEIQNKERASGSSKVDGTSIVNTHFRYQLRNVEFEVGIFLY